MIQLLNFIAGMNSTLESKYEGGELLEQTATEQTTVEHCFDSMDSYCSHCCNSTEYSVKSLREFFLSNNNHEVKAEVKPTSAKIERLPECKCREHTAVHQLPEKKPSNERVSETRSVQELKHLFEMKMKSHEQASTNGSFGTYSRPVSGKTDDRQDTVSQDPPHPEGQIFMYSESPALSKPCTRWNITNANVVEIPNGMQITITMMKDSKH
ncbi:uncharacterized protein LOC128709186 [Anopheles marshallii]|uniref:uncharacterized protein LOC128709186 n=1 Tax=Anopheles marshallii TaxID=1521116 RepID=UPI00237B3080|nr:uncharacterized protein LOC128709186 [Anopheles marshallii]